MKKWIVSVAVGVVASLVNVAVVGAVEFSDVNSDTTYGKAILKMSERGVIEGHADGSFKPEVCVNRAEMTKLLLETKFLVSDDNELQWVKDMIDGNFGGIGVELRMVNNKLVVVGVFDGGAAKETGLMVGDVIDKIDGKLVSDMTMLEAVMAIRGEVGTSVQLTITRGASSESLNFTIVREKFDSINVLVENFEDDYDHEVGKGWYSDVSQAAWYFPYVAFMSREWMIEGYSDGTFRPDNCVNRVEAIKMASGMFGGDFVDSTLGEHDGPWWEDIELGSWYEPYFNNFSFRNLIGIEHVVRLVDESVIGEERLYFKPDGGMSRAEVAEMLYRVLWIIENGVEDYDGMGSKV